MNKLKQNRLYLLGAVVVVAAVLIGGFLVLSKKSQPTFDNPSSSSEEQVLTLSPKDIGLVVTVRPDKLAVKFKITKAKDIKHVDYEISYSHVLEDQKVQEGITGEMKIAEDGITETDYRPFGTCSSGVCRYDKEISDVSILLKVEKTDGKTYSVEQKVSLE